MSALAAVGRPVLVVTQVTGAMLLGALRAARAALRFRVPLRETVRQVERSGLACLPLTVFASISVGCIVAVQGMGYVRRYSAPEVYGWAAYFSAVREVGPLLMGLALSARLGALHAAELAAMKATDRVDALRALGVDVHAVLVAPRILAMPLAAVLLMAWSDAVSLGSATLFAWAFGDVTPWTTWGSIHKYSLWSDLLLGLAKAAMYGLFSALAATAIGMSADAGADGVGRAVMRAAVVSIVVIVVLNHALTVGWAG
ncbi:MAG: ABC transporter permease [Deltaproteobacteria bacterium]|nr:ABC transporter permease [Deltaproteobacteria bacterium]